MTFLGGAFPVPNAEKAFGVRFGRHRNLNVYCPFHADADGTTISCSVSCDGVFACHSCGAKGDAITFYMKVHGVDRDEAIKQLTSGETYTPQPEVKGYDRGDNEVSLTEDHVRRTVRELWSNNPKYLQYLLKERGLTEATIREEDIGCDEWRITIPVRDEDRRVVNIRRYMPNASAQNVPKMVSHGKGDGSPRIWPAHLLERVEPGDEVAVNEGEWDNILLRQHKVVQHAFTNTGNAATWSQDWALLFRTNRMVVIYDVNDKPNEYTGIQHYGEHHARKRATEFRMLGCPSVKLVMLPLPKTYVGGDITNWFVDEKRTAAELRKVIDDTPEFQPTEADVAAALVGGIVPSTQTPGNGELFTPQAVTEGWTKAPLVTLDAAADASHYYNLIRVRVIVAGRGHAPFLVPSRLRSELYVENQAPTVQEYTFNSLNGHILSLMRCSGRTQKGNLKSILGFGADDKVSFEVLESMNVEEIHLIPTIDHEKDQGPYVLRKAFFVGRQLETNRVYDLLGYTLPDPENQMATHIFIEAKPAETNIDNFKLTPEKHKRLARIFQTDNVYAKFEDITAQLSSHVTHIYGRADLHTAVDLVFHSVLAFDFDGVRVRKGWLEGLLLGDTRTGKGFVSEGYSRHYGVGEIVSGENLTLAGIVGGVQTVGERWTLVWGKIPLADRRLIILDEAGGLSHTDIGKLSRIRSEGVAEITKIISEKTTARTRLLWLANPRPQPGTSPRVLSDYNFGVEAVPELIGAAEDVARFDFALVLARDEVATDLINVRHEPSKELLYDSQSCRDLVLWAWSRRPDQIVFDEGVTDTALAAAKALGSRFSSRICLIQAEDVRFKLVRIACAAAARVYSTRDGEILNVTKEHVEFAYNFLYHIYSKASCGYLQLSDADRERTCLHDPRLVEQALQMAGNREDILGLIEGLAENRLINARDIGDYANIDVTQARAVISNLLRARAITKENNGYVKRAAFKIYLTQLRQRMLAPDEPQFTQEELDDGTSNGHVNGLHAGPAVPDNNGSAEHEAAGGA